MTPAGATEPSSPPAGATTSQTQRGSRESRWSIRLLHILDIATGGEGAALACKAATDIPGIHHRVWLVGSEKDAATARLAGISSFQRVTMSGRAPETSARSLWRLRSDAPAGDSTETGASGFDAVLAYSPAAVALAGKVFSRPVKRPIVGVMPVSPAAAALAARPAQARRRLARCIQRATIVPLGEALQRAWAGALGLGATGIASPVAAPSYTAAMRAATRAELGIKPDEVAVLLLADPPSTGDARRFTQIVGMSRLAGAPVVGLMHAHTAQQPEGLRFAFSNRRLYELIRFQGPTLGAMAAADVCVWDSVSRPPGELQCAGGPVLALAAAAAGIPVVARAEALTAEVLAAAPACLAPSEHEHLFSKVILALVDERARSAAGAALRSHHTTRGVRWRFHAELLDSLRIITSDARTSHEWWQSLETGAVA